MREDHEGFLYPVVEAELCVQCGKCDAVCPVHQKKTGAYPTAYLAQNKNDAERQNSTSGGVFSVIARYVIERGGIVFGAVFNENFEVVHVSIDTIEQLPRLQGSKYVQSNLNRSFKTAQEELKKGRLVCFSGTPCQIEGLLNFLNRDYENLITVAVICYGAPSPKLFRKYVECVKDKFKDELVDYKFRSKKYGYASPTVVVNFAKNGEKDSRSLIKSFTKTYFSGLSMRPACYQCPFKTVEKRLDFMLGDCWNVASYCKDMDDNRGTTSVFVYSQKAENILQAAEQTLRCCEIDPRVLIDNDCSMIVRCKKEHKSREQFFAQIDQLPYEQLVQKTIPDKCSNYAANIIKPILYQLGIKDSKLLKMVKKFRVKKNAKS
jgi:coenzyme F420-reducing hydrogenase beta subunit